MLTSILHYTTLFSLAIGLIGVAIALLVNRQQLTTQIFLTVFSRYDELLENSSAGYWASLQPETELSEPNEELTMSVLRYYNNVFFMFFLYKWGRIPGKLWKIILPAVRRRLRSPAFLREWKVLQKEFEHLPDFSVFVRNIQHERAVIGRWHPTNPLKQRA
jgi:hypothetical protein